MPAVARSRLCSRVSAWAGLYARSAMSLAYSSSVIVCAGYLLSFILSIDVLRTYSRQMIKRYVANVSPRSTPATMLSSLCLHLGTGLLL